MLCFLNFVVISVLCAGNMTSDATKVTISHLCHKGTLLAYGQLDVFKDPGAVF